MSDKVFPYLVGELSTEQKKNVEFLVSGGAKSYDEYRHICGVIRGLTQAEFLIKDLVQRLENDDD